jgi:hypothetical protein
VPDTVVLRTSGRTQGLHGDVGKILIQGWVPRQYPPLFPFAPSLNNIKAFLNTKELFERTRRGYI